MLKIRHRITIDISTNEIDEFLIKQCVDGLGDVHSVSVIAMEEEHDQVKILASGLGEKDLKLKIARISTLVSNLDGFEMKNELRSLAESLGVSYPFGGAPLKNELMCETIL